METHLTERLDKLAEIVTGYSARGRVVADPSADFALLQTGDIDASGQFDHNTIEPSVIVGPNGPEPVKPHSRHLLREGDVLFISLGGGLRAVLVERDLSAIAAASSFFIVRVRDREVLDPGYLAWLLDQPPAKAHFELTAVGTYQGRVNKAALESLPVSLPPIHTQHVIARLAGLARDEDRLAREHAETRRALIDHTLLQLATGRLTPTPNA